MSINGNDRRTGHFGEGQCDGQQDRLFGGFSTDSSTVSSHVGDGYRAAKRSAVDEVSVDWDSPEWR